MTSNFLKLNSDKTEVLLIGTYQQLAKYRINSMSVAGIQVMLQRTPVRNLGVVFHVNMSMVSHVSSVIKSVTYHTRNVSRIRKYLTVDSAKGLVNSVVTSRLDYCKSLLAGIGKGQWDRLERAQRSASRVVLQLPRSVTPSLQDLHWLPIRFRVKFKIAVLGFKSIHGLAPNYLSDLLSYHAPARSLHFVDGLLLTAPQATLPTGSDRSFRVFAPQVWNEIPYTVRACESLNTFKKALKTFYFRKAFNC